MKTVLTSYYGMGAIFFKYEIAPIKVRYSMYKQTWADFMVHLSAIIGGTFAAAGIVESLLRNGLCLAMPGGTIKV
jgi:hypothetical protein